jgi:hypothetical protein
METSMARQKRTYSQEYRDEAVRMVIETSRPIAVVVRELGLWKAPSAIGSTRVERVTLWMNSRDCTRFSYS